MKVTVTFTRLELAALADASWRQATDADSMAGMSGDRAERARLYRYAEALDAMRLGGPLTTYRNRPKQSKGKS
jgi:hypothetical protein